MHPQISPGAEWLPGGPQKVLIVRCPGANTSEVPGACGQLVPIYHLVLAG